MPKPAASAPKEQQTEQNRPFSQEQLADAWIQLSSHQAFKSNERLLAMLSNIAPTLTTMPAFKVILRNTYQEKDLNQHKTAILQFLRQRLQNDGVRFEVEVNETQMKKVAYTPQEKFNLMAKENPNVAELAKMFNMQFS